MNITTSPMDKKYVIFAPHVDDETIGCWRQLKAGLVKEVYYFFDVDSVRQQEAFRAATKYGFEPYFPKDLNKPFLSRNDIILAPHIRDEHPHHKIVNYLAKSERQSIQYYSVDMNVNKDTLKNSFEKKNDLLELYPSQAKLFENEKYFLFESLLPTDISTSYVTTHQNVTITSEADMGVEYKRLIDTLNNPDTLFQEIVLANGHEYSVKMEWKDLDKTIVKEFKI